MDISPATIDTGMFFLYQKRKCQADHGYILCLVGQDNRKYGNTNILELKSVYFVQDLGILLPVCVRFSYICV